jgi:Prion-inhibition and propagation
MTRVRLEDWMRGLSACGGDLGSVLGANSMRYHLVLEALVLIVETFARVEEFERKYGITQTRPDVSSQRVQSIEGEAPGQKKSVSIFKTLRTHLRPNKQVRSSISSRSTSPAPSTSSLSRTNLLKFELAKLSLSDSSTFVDEKATIASHSTEADLDIDAPNLADCIIEMDKKAKECQKALSSVTKYEWVFSTQDELRLLIRDLEKYIAYLETLTRSIFQSKLYVY